MIANYRILNLNGQLLALLLLFFGISSCTDLASRDQGEVSQVLVSGNQAKNVIPAADQPGLYVPKLMGKKVGLVVNQSSRVLDKHLLDTLLSLDVNVKKIFVPEHGFRGDKADGAVINDEKDALTGLPVISLYGLNKKPTKDHLDDLDVLVFDLQDVGVRCYTYLSTLHYVMEAAAENGKAIIVLDRPNPNGYFIDGPVLDTEFSSFVGMHPVPLVYGMTIGEYALMINGEGWLSQGLKCVLDVIPLKYYDRDQNYQLPVKPSPNLPDQRAVLLYPSLVLFEGTEVSIGRGTDHPFQCFGHPDYGLGSYTFIPRSMPSSRSPKWEGKTCYGASLSALANDDIMGWRRLNLSWLLGMYEFLRDKTSFFREDEYFNKLAGTDQLKIALENGSTEAEIRLSWENHLEEFKSRREKYLLYPDYAY